MSHTLSGRLPIRRALARTPLRHQRGQALVYGLFVLISGLAALFYLFNVGQLSHEKTRLVNTADAVAYSGGLVEARSMNFAAYTNRALVANEVAIAQAVSIASWLEYMVNHGEMANSLGCYPYPYYYTLPVYRGLVRYTGVCWMLATASATSATQSVKDVFQELAPPLMAASDLAKSSLQAAAGVLPSLSVLARQQVMDQVSRANYLNLGRVDVDHLTNSALRDDFTQYGSSNSKRLAIELFTKNDNEGDRRQRMADMAVRSVRMDGFTPQRDWSDRGFPPGCPWNWSTGPRVNRSGATQLVNYDEWRASDNATYTEYYPGRWFRCRSSTQRLGYGNQSASTGGASTSNWTYSGIPSYLELTSEALSNNDPRMVYAVQLRRPLDQTSTSEGRSGLRNTTRINPYRASSVANDALYSLAGVEVFFQRPTARTDGQTELPSLFNPYWQVHLVDLPKDVQLKALALLGVSGS